MHAHSGVPQRHLSEQYSIRVHDTPAQSLLVLHGQLPWSLTVCANTLLDYRLAAKNLPQSLRRHTKRERRHVLNALELTEHDETGLCYFHGRMLRMRERMTASRHLP